MTCRTPPKRINRMKVILYDLDRPYDGMIEARCDHALAAKQPENRVTSPSAAGNQ